MSKHHSFILATIGMLLAFGLLPGAGAAQYVTVDVEINSEQRSALVKGTFSGERKNLTFLKEAIGSPDLGLRISEVSASGRSGQPLELRRFNSTEYVSGTNIGSFSYKVDLSPSANPRSAAHVSWLNADLGLLMLDDLLPLPSASGTRDAQIRLRTPSGWKLLGLEQAEAGAPFTVRDVLRSVLVLHRDMRLQPGQPDVAIAGKWHFSDAEVGSMATGILDEYRRLFGGIASERPRVIVLPFPQPNVPAGTWEAETRGSTVVLLSADTAFKSQSLQRLHEQLRHELFHLWLPNGVNLTGRYDWFYEGFALYQSLKTAVESNQIRFDDFLDTLSRAHNIDRGTSERRSLIQASEDRWRGAETQMYARGMVVAFLSDVAILASSKRKESIETLFRRLYSAHKFPASSADANTAVLAEFSKFPMTAAIVNDHIRGNSVVNWDDELLAAGIENRPGTSRTSLRIKEKLNGSQKALLDKLGYNSWRKLTRK